MRRRASLHQETTRWSRMQCAEGRLGHGCSIGGRPWRRQFKSGYRPSYTAAGIAAGLVFVLYRLTLAPETAMWRGHERVHRGGLHARHSASARQSDVRAHRARLHGCCRSRANIAMRVNVLAGALERGGGRHVVPDHGAGIDRLARRPLAAVGRSIGRGPGRVQPPLRCGTNRSSTRRCTPSRCSSSQSSRGSPYNGATIPTAERRIASLS